MKSKEVLIPMLVKISIESDYFMDYNSTEGVNYKTVYKETKPYFLLDTAHTTLVNHLN